MSWRGQAFVNISRALPQTAPTNQCAPGQASLLYQRAWAGTTLGE